jgi:hypothetical protein
MTMLQRLYQVTEKNLPLEVREHAYDEEYKQTNERSEYKHQ